jgi:hypothetical protein
MKKIVNASFACNFFVIIKLNEKLLNYCFFMQNLMAKIEFVYVFAAIKGFVKISYMEHTHLTNLFSCVGWGVVRLRSNNGRQPLC